VSDQNGNLDISGGHDALNPIKTNKGVPILTIDIWEHAYYVDYRNDRPKYVQSFWELVNWDFANENITKSKL